MKRIKESSRFENSIKRHISDVKNSRLRKDLPISINDSVIFPFREGFIFTKLRICEVSRKYSPRENLRIYSIHFLTNILYLWVLGTHKITNMIKNYLGSQPKHAHTNGYLHRWVSISTHS